MGGYLNIINFFNLHKDVKLAVGILRDSKVVISGKLIEIVERKGKGTQGCSYIYIAEGYKRGGTLVHIMKYASVMRELSLVRRSYLVPINLLRDKTLIRFSFSRSRLTYIEIGKIKDLELSELSWEHLPPREFVERFRGYRYLIQDKELREMIDEFEERIVPMVEDLREYEARLGFRISFMDKERRTEEAYNDPEFYYFTSMSIPDDRSRKKSLRVTRRWIYQLWVLKEVCEALEVRKFKAVDEDRPRWWIKQGSEIPTFIAETPLGDMTFWLEFQPSKMAHMVGIATKRRLPIRPDIVGVLGSYQYTRDLLNARKGIDLIVECKEDPFIRWKKDVESQILPYLNIFKPKNFLLVSLKPVPSHAAESIEGYGIKVVDNLNLESDRGREILRRYVREAMLR